MSYYSEAREYQIRGQLKKAYDLFKEGAKAKEEKCFFGLATLLSKQDIEKSERLFARYFDVIFSMAESEDSEAMYIISYYYSHGACIEAIESIHGIQTDEECEKKSIYWLEKSANGGYAFAQWLLGSYYENGHIVETNLQKAEQWYEAAVKQDFYKAKISLGKLQDRNHSSKIGTENLSELDAMLNLLTQSIEEEKKWDPYAAECGDLEAQRRICSNCRFWWMASPEEPEKIFRYLINLVEENPDDLICQSILAEMYCTGKGTSVDYQKAAEIFEYIVRKETNGDKDELKNSQWHLGLLYENGHGVNKNMDRAIQLYEASYKNRSPVGAFYLARQYRTGEFIDQDIDKYFKLLKYAADKGVAPAINALGQEYCSGEFKERDYKKAFDIWSGGSVWNISDKSLGERHFYLGQCYHNCRGVDYDIADESTKIERLKKAKEHYKKALEYGFNCRLALAMVNRDLGERSKGGDTRSYAQELLKSNVDKSELLTHVEISLEKDFGEYWNILKDNAKQALISGMFYYVMNISCGDEVCEKVDFTNVVATLSKALEIELAEFFGKGYIEFLRDIKKIPAHKFDPEYNKFVLYLSRPYGRKFVRDENAYVIKREAKVEYCDERNNYGFSLGSLYYIIGVETIPMSDPQILESKLHRQIVETKRGASVRTINPYMQEYARLLFREDAFGEGDFDEAAVNYLIDLAEDVRFIKDIRNPADHAVIVNRNNAEVLSDALIKTADYKILCDLLGKISPEYIQKSLEAPIKAMENKIL